MHSLTKPFLDYCEKNLILTSNVNYNYQSLSICIIDCVYSLRAVYKTMTVPVVNRYAAKYMNGDIEDSTDTISMLIQHIDDCGGPLDFADKILVNHQKIGGKHAISKSQVCYQLAKYLQALHIETMEDFRRFKYPELLEVVIHSVKGMGDAGTNYLFMLAGDPNRCKPDVHIHHCIQDACGKDISNEECQQLFTDTVNQLRGKYPDLTVRSLDSAIWNAYSNNKQTKIHRNSFRR